MAIVAASVPSWYSDMKVGRDTPTHLLQWMSIPTSTLNELRTTFHQELGLKCRHRCFGTLSVLRGDSGNRHASTRSLLKTYQMHLLQCVPITTSILKELRTIPSPRSVRNAIVAASVPSSAYNNRTDIKQHDVEL
eukprot:scaffold7806_cov35-Cyclotella_meneghiniana.AAC.4